MIDLKFSDLWGRWHHVTLSASEFTPEPDDVPGSASTARASACGASSRATWRSSPTSRTGVLDPFWDVPTLSFICSVVEADTKALYFRDPRVIAQRAEAYLRETRRRRREPLGPRVRVLRLRQAWRTTTASTWPPTGSTRPRPTGTAPRAGSATTCRCTAATTPSPRATSSRRLRTRIVTTLEAMGVPVKYHHHEVGGPGQCEIETPLMGLLAGGRRGADDQVRLEDGRAAVRPGGHLHAQAAVRRGRQRHALPPAHLQARRQPVLRPERLQPAQPDRAALHRRAAAPRARAAGAHQPVDQLVPPPGARLRGAGQLLLLHRQPLGRDPRARSTQPSPRPCAWSSGRPTPPATPTWRWPPC